MARARGAPGTDRRLRPSFDDAGERIVGAEAEARRALAAHVLHFHPEARLVRKLIACLPPNRRAELRTMKP